MQIPALSEYTWWFKWYMIVVVTEEGVFANEKVPDDYGGPQLTMEVVGKVVLAVRSGYFLTLNFDDYASVMDKTRKKGMGANYTAVKGIEEAVVIAATGPSTEKVTYLVRENPLFAQDSARMASVYAAARSSTL
jgi:hypothetical protein